MYSKLKMMNGRMIFNMITHLINLVNLNNNLVCEVIEYVEKILIPFVRERKDELNKGAAREAVSVLSGVVDIDILPTISEKIFLDAGIDYHEKYMNLLEDFLKLLKVIHEYNVIVLSNKLNGSIFEGVRYVSGEFKKSEAWDKNFDNYENIFFQRFIRFCAGWSIEMSPAIKERIRTRVHKYLQRADGYHYGDNMLTEINHAKMTANNIESDLNSVPITKIFNLKKRFCSDYSTYFDINSIVNNM